MLEIQSHGIGVWIDLTLKFELLHRSDSPNMIHRNSLPGLSPPTRDVDRFWEGVWIGADKKHKVKSSWCATFSLTRSQQHPRTRCPREYVQPPNCVDHQWGNLFVIPSLTDHLCLVYLCRYLLIHWYSVSQTSCTPLKGNCRDASKGAVHWKVNA